MTDIQLVRFFLGGIDESVLPDAVINMFMARYSELEQPLKIFNTCISCLQWLIAQSTVQGQTYTDRTEKIADEEIRVKGKSKVQAWQDLLDYILSNPDYIGPSLNSLKYSVVIGGVRNDQFRSVKADPNSRGPFDDKSPFTNHCNNIINFKYEE